MNRTRVAVLISGRGSNMAALLAAAPTDGKAPLDPVIAALTRRMNALAGDERFEEAGTCARFLSA